MKTLELKQSPLDFKVKMTSMPTVVGEIMNLASDPRTSVARLSSILLKDPSLAKGILRKANSPGTTDFSTGSIRSTLQSFFWDSTC